MKKKPRPRQVYTLEQWKKIIEDWKNSGLSSYAYCKQKDIGETAFWRWKQKIMSLSSPQQSLKVLQDSNSHSSLQENMNPDPFNSGSPAKYRSNSQRFYTPEQKKGFFEEWKKSGLPIDTYSRQKNLSRTSFYYWVQEFKRLESSPQTPQKRLSSSPRLHTLEQRQAFVEEWKKSGLSKDTFARQKGLNHSTFWNWEKESRLLALSSPSSSPSQKLKTQSSFEEHFIPVTLKPSPFVNSSNVSPKIEVTLSQGDHLSIQGPFEWESLISLLTSLLRR